LFIDCDSQISSISYIKNYLSVIKDYQIVCGGRSYHKNRPAENELYLRWLYGVKRESSNGETRNLKPNNSFMTNNFIISSELFQKVRFDESINKYGHEDTLFGID